MLDTAPALRRLRARSEFLFVRQGVKAVRPTVIVEARRRTLDGTCGVGFTASKKIGRAVIRNRARRRLKEAARRSVPRLGAAGADYVFVARAATPEAPWSALLDDIESALISVAAALDRASERRPRRARPSQKATD
ncbi:MAG: ribonuclease P protein component [Hyphomonadaceae bacterium]|nr:ribonuclease P protein component [Hyphomonadaceae bacterium]